MGGREPLLLLHQQVKPNSDSRSAQEHYKQSVVFSLFGAKNALVIKMLTQYRAIEECGFVKSWA
jgi:hypothetical protein